jgi:hypothetical protein
MVKGDGEGHHKDEVGACEEASSDIEETGTTVVSVAGAEDVAAGSVGHEEVHQAVSEMLTEMSAGEGLPALLYVESAVAAKLGAPCFGSLGHGSLLEFVATSSALTLLAQRAVGGGGGARHGSLNLLLSCEQLARQVLLTLPPAISSSDKEQAARVALASHCGLSSTAEVEAALGFSMTDFLTIAQQSSSATSDGVSDSPIVASATILVSASPPVSTVGTVGCLGDVDKTMALRCLSAAPAMVDLLQWTHWRTVFQAGLGPLPDFLQREAVHPALASMRLLGTRDGKLLKVPASASMDALAEAVGAGNARAAVAELLSIVLASGSLEQSPRMRMVTSVTGGLASLARIGGEQACAAMWLECLESLPAELRSPLAEVVLLPAFTEAVGKQHSHRLLCEASASTSAQASAALTALGLELGEEMWAAEWMVEWAEEAGDRRISLINTPGSCSSSGSPEVKRSQGTSNETDVPGALPSWLSVTSPNAKEEMSTVENVTSIGMGVGYAGGDDETSGEVAPGSSDGVGVAKGGEEEDGEAHAVVETIRRKLGILQHGLEGLHDDVRRCLDEYPKLMGRACEKLSNDLYSEDSHFVLELIQNADDNAYGGEVRPALLFIVDPSSITVLNNEVGFSADNIRALCNVGDSTKSQKKGYTGQKGIGFKSVFRVTDKPSVHSGGYHIAFDMSAPHGKLNFILPTWLTPHYLLDSPVAAASPDVASELQSPQWRTAIHLPMRTEPTGDQQQHGACQHVAYDFEE